MKELIVMLLCLILIILTEIKEGINQGSPEVVGESALATEVLYSTIVRSVV